MGEWNIGRLGHLEPGCGHPVCLCGLAKQGRAGLGRATVAVTVVGAVSRLFPSQLGPGRPLKIIAPSQPVGFLAQLAHYSQTS